jgi:hypothetical protein
VGSIKAVVIPIVEMNVPRVIAILSFNSTANGEVA